MSQTIDQMWLWILAVAAPIAGVVGFALKLLQLKRARREEEKLQLEVDELRAAHAAKERRVVVATLDEIKRFGRWPPSGTYSMRAASWSPKIWAIILFVIFLLLLFFAKPT